MQISTHNCSSMLPLGHMNGHSIDILRSIPRHVDSGCSAPCASLDSAVPWASLDSPPSSFTIRFYIKYTTKLYRISAEMSLLTKFWPQPPNIGLSLDCKCLASTTTRPCLASLKKYVKQRLTVCTTQKTLKLASRTKWKFSQIYTRHAWIYNDKLCTVTAVLMTLCSLRLRLSAFCFLSGLHFCSYSKRKPLW